MDPIVFELSGDPAVALQTALGAIGGIGYRVTPAHDGWSGRAEVGSPVARAFGGGFTRRMIVDYRVEAGPGGSRLVIVPAATGWSGGALGASKAKKEFRSVTETIGTALHQQGLLTPPPGAAPPPPPPPPS